MKSPAVLKFGGTSLETPARIRAVADIVTERARSERVVVVVSAMAGVTDALIHMAGQAAAGGRAAAEQEIAVVADRHIAAARAVAPQAEHAAIEQALQRGFADLRSLAHGISLVHDCSPRVLDAVVAFGELFSATLVAAALRSNGVPAMAIDARHLIVTDDAFGSARVDRARTDERVRAAGLGQGAVPVVTGFIAAAENGTTTTLGRGGSDYTATLLGAALEAGIIEIWTDVDGVMSADPRLVPQAYPLRQLSYVELMELSHFGAKVVHPPAVAPARERQIPLLIRNTLNPSFEGTRVLPYVPPDAVSARRRGPVCGISSIHNISLCRLEGAGMVGVPGISSRLFGALARAGISVILISQASSEHSICFALEPAQAARARRHIDQEFEVEGRAGAVDPLVVEESYSILAVVGEAMRETPGLAGRVFDVLGRNGINVRAIAQGSSELNLSLVVSSANEARALRLIHDAFFLPGVRNVQVFVAGTGRVGAALLDQMAAEHGALEERVGLRLIVGGVARSGIAHIAPDGLALGSWRDDLSRAEAPSALMLDTALVSPNAHRIFVDCTANAQLAGRYLDLLRSGVAIVTANKIALSGTLADYHRLRTAARRGNGICAETTVGAGLPVLRPIADLVATGDAITHIEGVLSGTLSFLFAQVMKGVPFSEAVRDAHARGFTEPDPREDLNGRDVARKLLILAREAGFPLEPDDVRVEPALPGEHWADLSQERFWETLPSVDAAFAAKRAAALAAGKSLSYLGVTRSDGAEVRLDTIDRAHPAADLLPGDNLIAITSARYAERPLVIRGPGAGPDVTAAGVFADILRAAIEAR
jgi:aspartokinase/homoserine dehydrogenase 1